MTDLGRAITEVERLTAKVEAQAKRIAELEAALRQIAMEQTARTPEQAMQYFQHVARQAIS